MQAGWGAPLMSKRSKGSKVASPCGRCDHSYSDATPAETALAEAAWNLASMLSLVVIDAGAGSWNNEWNQDVDRFSAALDKVPGS
jgi:hypothetical protein